MASIADVSKKVQGKKNTHALPGDTKRIKEICPSDGPFI